MEQIPNIEMFRLKNDGDGSAVLKILKKCLNHKRYHLRARGRKPDRTKCGDRKFRDGHVRREWAKEIAVYIDDHFEYDKERKAQKRVWGLEEENKKLKSAVSSLKEECVMLQIDRKHISMQLEDAKKSLQEKTLTNSMIHVTDPAVYPQIAPENGMNIDSAITRIKDVLEQYQERQYKLKHENKYRDVLIAVWKSIGALDEQISELMQDEQP